MSPTLPPLDEEQQARVVNILLNTYKDPNYGPQYMLDNIHLIVGYIQRLENKFIVNIVIGVLEFTQLNIKAVRQLTKSEGGNNPVNPV